MMARFFGGLLCLFPLLTLLHLYFSPYTKVEESFNIQAAHDILAYGVPTESIGARLRADFDHFTFPGAVPRTFVGALVLAGFSMPVVWLFPSVNQQLLVRALLGLFNSLALIVYARGVSKAYGRIAACWYIVFQAGQFHVIYYASRTLPNMFAFGISTLALRYLLPDQAILSNPDRRAKRLRLSLYLLSVAGIVLRSELAVLLFTITSFLYLTGQISIRHEIIPAAISSLVVGLLLTVSVDSFFWQQFPLWPELASFKFNLISGHASEWGVSSVYYYFNTSLPRLLLNPVTYALCIPFALSRPGIRSSATSLLLPSLNYLLVYSLLPHKEWRFIIYVMPPITTAAALGAASIWIRSGKKPAYRIFSSLMLLSVLGSFVISNLVLLPISSLNYPGGKALALLHSQAQSDKQIVSVYMDNLACQTGVTRFLQLPPPKGFQDKENKLWIYDKTEDEELLLTPSFWETFDFVLAEHPEKVIGAWEIMDTVDGFAGLTAIPPGHDSWMRKTAKEALEKQDRAQRNPSRFVVSAFEAVETMLRKHVTQGWWLDVKMEPKIRILRRAAAHVP